MSDDPADPPCYEHTKNRDHTSAPAERDGSSGGQPDIDIVHKEWARDRRQKKEHSLAVAVTRSQRPGQAKATKRGIKRSEKQQEELRAGRNKQPIGDLDAEEKRCAQCAAWFRPRPCPKHPGKMTKYCEDCKPSQPAGGGSNPTNAVGSKGAQADDNSQLIFKVNVDGGLQLYDVRL